LVGASAAQPLGAIRMNSDTTGTNTRSSAVIITNLSGSGNTGVMLRDSQHTNSVKVLSLTGDRVAIVHTDKTLTNSFITVTWLNSLSNVVGNIQEQINNIISSGTNNWINEGTTNSTLAGIGKPWALEVTNSVQVGALGEAGLIELVSTNGTYAVTLGLDANGTLTVAYGSTNMLTLQVGAASGYGGAGTKYLADGGTFVTPSSPIGTVTNININPTDGYLPYRSNATVFGDSPIQVMTTNRVRITDGSAILDLGISSSNPTLDGTGGLGTFRIAGPSNSGLNIQAGRINPISSGIDLSGPNVTSDFWYDELGLDNRLSLRGFFTGASSNNAYMWIDHTGTNGVVQINSQSGGIAGPARDFSFTSNTVQIARINANSGYSGAGTKFLADDGTYKTAVIAYGAACSDLTTPLTTGTVKGIIRLPHAMTVTEVRASLLTAQTSGATFTVDIEENGTTILSTPITIDNGSTTSVGAAVPPVISDSALADDSIITLDITQVGDGTAVGLQFWIIGTIAP
jgi:hypothetical protein